MALDFPTATIISYLPPEQDAASTPNTCLVPGESYFQQKNLWWTVSIARHSMVVGAPLAVCGLLLGDHGAYGHQLGSPRYDDLLKIYKS